MKGYIRIYRDVYIGRYRDLHICKDTYGDWQGHNYRDRQGYTAKHRDILPATSLGCR